MKKQALFMVCLCASIVLFSQQAFADLSPMASLDLFDQNGSFYLSSTSPSTLTSENWSDGTAYSWRTEALSGTTINEDPVFDGVTNTWYYPRHVDNLISLLTFNFSDGQQYTATMSGTFYFTIAYTYNGSMYVLNPQLSTISSHGSGTVNGHPDYMIFTNVTGYITQADPGVGASGVITSLTGSIQYQGAPASAGFTSSSVSGTEPLTVNFTDQSTGSLTGWSWSFGDGGTSTAQNPSHTYTSPGIYSVSLTVSGPGGSDTETKTGYISVYCACNLNNDSRCDMRDWLLFGQRWGSTDCSSIPCACDLNADGRCDMRDWLIFGRSWGRTDCPVQTDNSRFYGSYIVNFAIDSCGEEQGVWVLGNDLSKVDDSYIYIPPTGTTHTMTYESSGDVTTRTVTISGDTVTMDALWEEGDLGFAGHFVLEFSADTNTISISGYTDEYDPADCDGEVVGTGERVDDGVDNTAFFGSYTMHYTLSESPLGEDCTEDFTLTIGGDPARMAEEDYLYVPQHENGAYYAFIDVDGGLTQRTVIIEGTTITLDEYWEHEDEPGNEKESFFVFSFSGTYGTIAISGEVDELNPWECEGDVEGTGTRN